MDLSSLQKSLIPKDLHVFETADGAANHVSQLILRQLELLTDGMLKRQILPLFFRTPRPEDDTTFMNKPGEPVAAIARLESQLVDDSVELGGLDGHGCSCTTR